MYNLEVVVFQKVEREVSIHKRPAAIPGEIHVGRLSSKFLLKRL